MVSIAENNRLLKVAKKGERGVMESKVHYYSGFKFCRMLHTTQRDDIIGCILILKEYSYYFTVAF